MLLRIVRKSTPLAVSAELCTQQELSASAELSSQQEK